MKNYKYVKLSSKYSALGFWGSAFLFVFIFLLVILLFPTSISDFQLNIVIGISIMLLLLIVCVFCLLHICQAEIRDNKFYLKKYYKGKEEVYELSQLTALSKWENKKDDYIIFTITDQGVKHRFLLFSSKNIFYEESLNTEGVLNEILDYNQHINH